MSFIRSCLNYLPGVLILIFSMIALRASIVVIEDHKALDHYLHTTHSEAGAAHLAAHRDGFVLHGDTEGRLLYWSVIMVGFSGFLLLILNTHKLKKLRRAEDARRETFRFLEGRMAAIESASDGIAIMDSEGRLTYMNKSLAHMHGIEDKDIGAFTGQLWSVLYGTDDGQDIIKSQAMPSLRDAGHWQGELIVTPQSGGGEEVNVDISATKLASGGFVVTARNVTERKKDHQQREELQRQVHQAQKMEAIGRLAGGIAHDFNNILAAMNGYAEFLIDDLDPEIPQHQFAQNILLAGHQARDVVDQMLTFSRQGSMERHVMDLLRPLQDSLSILDASLPKTIEIKTNITVDEAFVLANATQISQIIMNLCVNARDAMANEHGVLSVRVDHVPASQYDQYHIVSDELPVVNDIPTARIDRVDERHTRLILGAMGRAHEYVRLSIEDDGSGMSFDVMENIFDPFFTTKPVNKGTGLGLSTVHGIISAHQGAMIINSTVGQGTSFELFFPVADFDEQQDIIEDIGPVQHAGGSVLLVEDQENVRDMMISMMRRQGFEVEHTATGEEALSVLKENPGYFDIVVTDQSMPKMTGVELVQAAYPLFPDLPFVLLSGYSKKKLADLKADNPGIRATLRKPVTHAVLIREIHEILSSLQEEKEQGAA